MLAVQKRPSSDVCTLNILPCRIHHIGPTKVTKRYWNPTTGDDGTTSSYFRGRRLRGKPVQLPPAYEGLILKATQKSVVQPARQRVEDNSDLEDDEVQEVSEPVKIMEQVSAFNEVIVWGHDQLPATDDSYVKGINEWVAFAEAINADASAAVSQNNKQELQS